MGEKTNIRSITFTECQKSEIKNMIYPLRGKHVMLDKELANIYQVELKRMNEQVKRNIARFPVNFRFQVTEDEYSALRSQNATLNNQSGRRGQHSKYLPYVFTEQGVAMLSSVLNSETAIKVSIAIINAFIDMRQHISEFSIDSKRLDVLELKQLKNEQKFNQIFQEMRKKDLPSQGIFFDGEVFDAHVFASDLIKTAKTSIILIDNYIDEQTLKLMSNKDDDVKITIYTHQPRPDKELAQKRFREQYPSTEIHIFKRSHDRFLIIDKKEIYHVGASLKDLGKKWFAFTKLDISPNIVLERLNP
jgi:ORF6N domain